MGRLDLTSPNNFEILVGPGETTFFYPYAKNQMRDEGGGGGGGRGGHWSTISKVTITLSRIFESQKLGLSYRVLQDPVTHMCAISLIYLLRQFTRV